MTGPSPQAATLGEPSYVWRAGQERRLSLIRSHTPLEGRRILDVGCGVGTYVRRLRQLDAEVYGIDISVSRLRTASREGSGFAAAVAEHLPFKDESFDVILLNEVIEHVQDDRETLRECVRVLAPRGDIIIFAPNRLYPFETHGVQLGGKYIFGNIPLVNYLPDRLRNRLVPHARAYRARELSRLIAGLGVQPIVRGYVYPGFDNIAARSGLLAGLLRTALYRAEHTRLQRFGLSHFQILERSS